LDRQGSRRHRPWRHITHTIYILSTMCWREAAADARRPEVGAKDVHTRWVTTGGETAGRFAVVRARDGLDLREYEWPAAGRARAHLLIVHGIAERGGRYRHVAMQLANAGITTHAYDQRGFGGSGGHRAYVDRWSQYHDDLEDRLAEVRGEAGGIPGVPDGPSSGGGTRP